MGVGDSALAMERRAMTRGAGLGPFSITMKEKEGGMDKETRGKKKKKVKEEKDEAEIEVEFFLLLVSFEQQLEEVDG